MEILDVLAKMDERMAKLAEFMAVCHHGAAAAHQTAAVALSRFAEVSLGGDRCVALAERRIAERK